MAVVEKKKAAAISHDVAEIGAGSGEAGAQKGEIDTCQGHQEAGHLQGGEAVIHQEMRPDGHPEGLGAVKDGARQRW